MLTAAVCCTALAIFLPWAHYGGIDFALHRFPAWYVYVAAVLFGSPVVPAMAARPGLGALFALAGVVLSAVLVVRRF